MKKLVVPVDFSEESMVAIENAIALANKAKLSIRMIHIKKKKTYYLGFPVSSQEEQPDEVYQAYFDKIIDKYKIRYTAGGTFDYRIGHGSISHEILKESNSDDVYAIYTGLQGNTSLKDYLIGSNACRVVAGSQKPVFTVRKGMGVVGLEKILMPIDESPSTRIKVPIVTALAKAVGAKVVVLAVSERSYPEVNTKIALYAKQAMDYLDQNSVECEMIEAFNSDAYKTIIENVSDHSIDLLAIMSDMTDDPIGHFLSGAVQNILNTCECPLLCIPINI